MYNTSAGTIQDLGLEVSGSRNTIAQDAANPRMMKKSFDIRWLLEFNS